MNPNTPTPTDQPADEPGAQPTPFAQPTYQPEGTPPVVPVEPQVLQTEQPQQGNPTPPFTPFAATPAPIPVAPTPPVAAKSKKPFIIAAIIGGVVLVAAIAAVLFFVFMNVSKQDYAAATTQYNKVSSANSKLATEVPSLTSDVTRADDATFNKDVETVESAIAALKTENEALGKLKAVKVGEGSKLYNQFDTKLTAYLAYGSDLVSSIKAVRPALVKCSDVSDAKDTTSRVTALKACSTAFNEVGSIANAEFKTYIDTVKVKYADYTTTYESIAALTSPYGAQYDQYKTLRDKMYSIQDDISAASKEFTASQDKRDKELSVKDSATALANYLDEQQK